MGCMNGRISAPLWFLILCVLVGFVCPGVLVFLCFDSMGPHIHLIKACFHTRTSFYLILTQRSSLRSCLPILTITRTSPIHSPTHFHILVPCALPFEALTANWHSSNSPSSPPDGEGGCSGQGELWETIVYPDKPYDTGWFFTLCTCETLVIKTKIKPQLCFIV